MTYREQLADPRWQRRRLEVLEAHGWACDACADKTKPLHVHHGYYRRGAEPWDYPDAALHVLCEDCHRNTHDALGGKSEVRPVRVVRHHAGDKCDVELFVGRLA